MKAEKLTIKKLEKKVGSPASKWHGRCAEIASHAADMIDGAISVYGHYIGPIDPDGYWSRPNAGFEQHGWVILEDGRVLDPTRFSFENKGPYIYMGKKGDKDYDEGGNAFRMATHRPCPSAEGGRLANLENLESHEIQALETVLSTSIKDVTAEQLYWIANAPYQFLGIFVRSIYESLGKNKLKALVPMDNWNRAVRERGLPSEFKKAS